MLYSLFLFIDEIEARCMNHVWVGSGQPAPIEVRGGGGGEQGRGWPGGGAAGGCRGPIGP